MLHPRRLPLLGLLLMIPASPAQAAPTKVTRLDGIVTYSETKEQSIDDGRGTRMWRDEARGLSLAVSLRRDPRSPGAWVPINVNSSYTGDYRLKDSTSFDYIRGGCSTDQSGGLDIVDPVPLAINTSRPEVNALAVAALPRRRTLSAATNALTIHPRILQTVTLWSRVPGGDPFGGEPFTRPDGSTSYDSCGMGYKQAMAVVDLAPAASQRSRCVPAGVRRKIAQSAPVGTIFGVWRNKERTFEFTCDRLVNLEGGIRITTTVRGELTAP